MNMSNSVASRTQVLRDLQLPLGSTNIQMLPFGNLVISCTARKCCQLGSQVGELQHYYVSPCSYLWTLGLHNCVDYAFLFVGIVEGGGEVMATCFDLWGWG